MRQVRDTVHLRRKKAAVQLKKIRHNYTKDVLGGVQISQDGEQKIHGVRWNFICFVYDLNELATLVKNA